MYHLSGFKKGVNMRLIDADAMLKRNEHSIYDTTDLKEMLDYEPTVCKWHEIKTKADLPKEQGYYLVAIERYKDWGTKEKCYYTNFIFFRGKTTWATYNGSIKAWMELPEEFKK
jgi:hypothetical protein